MPRVALVLALVLLSASCTGDPVSTESTETTEPASVTTEDSAATTSTAGPSEDSTTTTVTVEDQMQIIDEDGLGSPDGSWDAIDHSFFVWGVESGDVLNVRSGAGVNNPIAATIAPGTGGLTVYGVFEIVGNSNWVPVQVTQDGRVGWVSNNFLRPDPPVGGPAIQGSATPEVLALVDAVIEALDDSEALADLVGSEGLTFSPFAYVGDDAVTLTKDQIADESDVDRVWGVTSGRGDDIVATLDEYLDGLVGRTAVTSTAEIGYDVTIGGGNSINNLVDVFPDANFVEYYHPGTSYFGGLDWTALRFVFEEDSEQLVLRALISDQWEI